MITRATLKRDPHYRKHLPPVLEGEAYEFSVSCGLLVFRNRETGKVQSVPLSEVSIFDGCPALPPKKAGKRG